MGVSETFGPLIAGPLYNAVVDGGHCEVLGHSAQREAWLKLRREGVGASELAALLGVSPWNSWVSLYADKIGVVEDTGPNDAQRWGLRLERIVLEAFGEETGRKVFPSGALLRSTHMPLCLATLDGCQEDPHRGAGAVEIKVTRFAWDEVPREYWVQLQHQLFVSGFKWGSVVALCGGTELVYDDIEFDAEWYGNEALPKILAFWDYVRRKETPPAPERGDEAVERTKRALVEIYPKHTPGSLIELKDPSWVELDEELERAKQLRKRWKDRVDEIENRFRHAIGPAEVALLANGASYSNRTQHTDAYDVKAYDARVLRRKAPKGEK